MFAGRYAPGADDLPPTAYASDRGCGHVVVMADYHEAPWLATMA
jgi:hypothetical protein